MKNVESQIQKACVKWFRYQYPKLLLFSIPNGGKRGIITAMNMKAEGTVSGVADLMLLHSNPLYHGLFIEMKAPKGKQSEPQKEFEFYCLSNDYQYSLCRSLEEFMFIVNQYINLRVK